VKVWPFKFVDSQPTHERKEVEVN